MLFIICFKTSMYVIFVHLTMFGCFSCTLCTTNEDSSSHSILALVPASWLDLTPSQNNCVRSSSSNKMCEIFIFFSVWWNSQSKELNKFQRWVGTYLLVLVSKNQIWTRSERNNCGCVIWWNPSLVVDQSGIRWLFKLQWAAISEKGELTLFLNRSLPWHLLVPYW